MESIINNSALRHRPRVEPDRAGADRAAADRRLARARPSTGSTSQRRAHRGSAETSDTHIRARGPGSRTHVAARLYINDAHLASPPTPALDTGRVAWLSRINSPVCLVQVPRARAADYYQTQSAYFVRALADCEKRRWVGVSL